MLEQYMVNDYSFTDYAKINHSLLYIDYIRLGYTYDIVVIEPIKATYYQGNFFGLLRSLNVSENLYLFTLYVNGYTHPNQFRDDRYEIKIPFKPVIPSN